MTEYQTLNSALDSLKGRVSFHVPGHKGALNIKDTTELPRTDDALRPTAVITRLEERLSRLFSAQYTCLSTCGSTAGVMAMILSAVKPGEKLLLPRLSHISAYHACILGGIEPLYIGAGYDEASDYCYTSEKSLIDALDKHPDAKALLVTRPDYYGAMMPLKYMAEKARQNNVKLLVDEAHGAHLNLIGMDSACDYADMWVQSAHKTLHALTPAAMLHAHREADMVSMRRALRLVHTSSPSYPVLASVEDMAALIEHMDIRPPLESMRRLRDAIINSDRYTDHALTLERLGLTADPTRLVFSCDGATGFALRDALEAVGIDVEMADARRVVCVLSLTDDAATYHLLLDKLSEINLGNTHQIPPLYRPYNGVVCMSPREAALSDTEPIRPEDAQGRIAAVCVGIYPPGVPLIVPGERISYEAISALIRARSCGAGLFGIENGYIPITQGVE